MAYEATRSNWLKGWRLERANLGSERLILLHLLHQYGDGITRAELQLALGPFLRAEPREKLQQSVIEAHRSKVGCSNTRIGAEFIECRKICKVFIFQ